MNAAATRLIAVREKAGLDVLGLALLFGISTAQIYAAEGGRAFGQTYIGRYVDHNLIDEAEAFRLQRASRASA